jgi:hypothetical protein
MVLSGNELRSELEVSSAWKETSWDKITIDEVIDYLNKKKVPIVLYDTKHVYDEAVSSNLDLDELRVDHANLEFPIIIVKQNNKLQYVLDGNHRLAKARRDEHKNIKARILDLDGSNIPMQFIETF